MNRAEKCRMIENHGIMIKTTEDGTYRTATEYEQKNGLSDGIFLPVKKYLEAGRKVGYIIDRSNRHKVMTYRAYIENDTYKITGDSVGNSSDPENYINFEDKWSLHELILITDLFCDRYSNSEKARLLDYWGASRSTEVEINHKNKDKHTRDVDNLEICTRSKNRVHRSNYDLIEKVLSGKLAEAPSVRLDEPFNPVERRNIHISGCCCGRLFKGQRPPCRLHGGL